MMGSLGPAELVVIAIAAIVVFGPKRLPEIARTAAELLQKARAATETLTNAMDTEFNGVAAPLRDLKSEYDQTMLTIKEMAPSASSTSFKLPDGKPRKEATEELTDEDPDTIDGEEPAAEIEQQDDEQAPIDEQHSQRPTGYDKTMQAIKGMASTTPNATFVLPDGKPGQGKEKTSTPKQQDVSAGEESTVQSQATGPESEPAVAVYTGDEEVAL